ncbi:zinc finger CCCH domain-containing protein 18-like [Grus americana]|uniref:zinc finger CCCH domain-containing protein 18-like n=1 Tax=Grus americana TaxID=9117 RepID=UPI002407881C|nr:zinc finger CCCH domain-containing protein 18-like [Grus americana]
MAPTHRLLLVFLLLVALHARAAWAAPWRAQGADEDADNGASWLDVDLEPLEHPGAVPAGEGDPTSRLGSRSEAPADRVVTDVPVGRAFPAPQLDAVPQAGWHRRGPPRAQYHQAEGGKKRPEPSPLLRKMLDELERRHKTDREAVKKLLFPDGSSGSLPVPPDEAQATQGAGTPVLSESGEDHQASRFFPSGLRRAMAGSGDWLEAGGRPSRPDSRTSRSSIASRPGSPESWTENQQPGLLPGKPVRSAPPRPPRPASTQPSSPDSTISQSSIASWTSYPSSPESGTESQQPALLPGKPARSASPRFPQSSHQASARPSHQAATRPSQQAATRPSHAASTRCCTSVRVVPTANPARHQPSAAVVQAGAGHTGSSNQWRGHDALGEPTATASDTNLSAARLRPDASRQGSCNKGELLRSRVAGLLLLAGPEIPRLRFPVVLGPASSSYPGDSARKTAELWAQPVTDVPVGRAFPAPQLDAVPQAGWHRRGPPRAQYHQPEGGKKRPEPSPLLREMLDELERRHKTDREAVKKLLFPDGSSGSLPVPPDEAQATQGAGTPVLSESGEDHQASRYDFFQADSDAVGKRIASADRPQRTAGVLCPQDVRRRCMIGTAAGVISVPVIIVVCCIVIHWRRQKKKE